MKRLTLLLVLFALFLLLTLTFERWFPWLFSNLSDDQTGGAIQSFSSSLDILFKVATFVLGLLTVMGWRKSPQAQVVVIEKTPEEKDSYAQQRNYEPKPLDLQQTPLDVELPPYLGLRAFQKQDAHLFYGRQHETREALAWLGAPLHNSNAGNEAVYRWLQIEGNSGAGKSSLVNAGMLPLIEKGVLQQQTGYSQWTVIGPMMPGETPLRRLAEVLEQALVSDSAKRDTLNRQHKLEQDHRALAYMLNDCKQADNAFLLVVDQFEELFTFSDAKEKQRFDAQLAYALEDRDCPLFLINTVRIDYLQGFEHLAQLSELYNTRCKRYLLKTISQQGLREAIERPAQLAGLDVSEVTAAILRDASGEIGALPLVENALHYLWEQREGNRLSGALYTEKGGIAGLLEMQADRLLEQIDNDIPKGKSDALELLLALTRISDQGNHTRRRLSLGEARIVAGGKKKDAQRGQRIIDYLSGAPGPKNPTSARINGSLRLISTTNEAGTTSQPAADSEPSPGQSYVDLIHETLIRSRGKDPVTGKPYGYWQTLYQYIEKNRDRSFYRDQLTRRASEWQACKGLSRWRKVAGLGELRHYRKFYPDRDETEYHFKRSSQRASLLKAGVLAALLGFVGQAYWWTLDEGFPPGYMLTLQKFRLMHWGILPEAIPEMVSIRAPKGTLRIGEYDEGFGESVNQQLKEAGAYNQLNFGYPAIDATIDKDFAIGKYEVTYEQFDYYVWQQQHSETPPVYPGGPSTGNGRGKLAVVNVSWQDANGYLQWLQGRPEGAEYEYRLPTEAEWEYAARAGTDTPYWWGEEAGDNRANCSGCGSGFEKKQLIAPVGSFEDNAYGLHDTAGNVWEWTSSEWKVELDGSASEPKPAEDTEGLRALRGGSWLSPTDWLRSSARSRSYSDDRVNNVGFRVFRAARTK